MQIFKHFFCSTYSQRYEHFGHADWSTARPRALPTYTCIFIFKNWTRHVETNEFMC